MPSRKKYNCESIIAMKKQKKIIDNRLLEISILVEDYIYEDKPIKRYEAEMYAKEVASYVDKCLGDIRSLQVIEKLRRHMRGIIQEQGETVDEDIFAQPILGTTPVLDDDLTQYTQDVEVKDYTHEGDSLNCVEEPIKKGRNKRQATVKRNIRVGSGLDDDLTQCTQDIESEDHNKKKCSLNSTKTPTKNVKNKRTTKKRNMIKTCSLDDDMTQYTQADSDIQEINSLDSVEKTTKRARNIRNTVVKSNIRNTNVKRNNSRNHNSDLDVIDLCDDNDDKVPEYCTNVESPPDLISSLYSPNTPAFFSACSPSILNSFDTVPKIPKYITKEVFEKPNPDANVINTVKNGEQSKKTINDSIGLIKEFTVRNTPEEKNITFAIKDNDIENIKGNQINTQVNNIGNLKIISSISSVNPIDTPKNKVNKALNTYSKVNSIKKCSVYSEKVINDLSWIKNIRYVREIAKEEYEKVLVPDNFWDNYMLPEKWNDDDFLYT